jgi:hypothetical protein
LEIEHRVLVVDARVLEAKLVPMRRADPISARRKHLVAEEGAVPEDHYLKDWFLTAHGVLLVFSAGYGVPRRVFGAKTPPGNLPINRVQNLITGALPTHANEFERQTGARILQPLLVRVDPVTRCESSKN